MGDCSSEPGREELEEKEVENHTSNHEGEVKTLRKEASFSRWCNDRALTAEISLVDDMERNSEEFGRNISPMDIENGAKIESKPDGNSVSPFFILKILVYILIWYTLSTCLTLYNKEMLGRKYFHFPAPLLMNTVHFTMQAVLSKIILYLRKSENKADKMSWKDYSIRVVPLGLATALDINLSNVSLIFITVTFATMCKSAGPIFILLFAFAFRLERPSFKLLGIMLVISIGVLLSVAKAAEFNFWGFVLIMLAAILSGFRWAMTQILLQKEAYGLKDPITLMSYVTPVMALVTGVLSLAMDPWTEFSQNKFFNNPSHILRSVLLMLFGGSMAFLMVLIEYVLVSDTSALTVTVVGIFKDAVTILVAVLFFNDEFTWLRGVGLAIIIFGVCLFNWYKYQKLKKGHENKEELNGGAKYVILDDDIDSQDDDH